jgi:hypothetical protein
MIHLVTEQLAGDKVAEYSVSALALNAWAKIVAKSCDGEESATAWATWDGESLSVEHVDGDGDRLFGEWPLSRLEIALREAYAELPECGDGGHPTACGCDDQGVLDSTVALANIVELKMSRESEAWTLLQAMEATVSHEPTTATIADRERTRTAIDFLVQAGRVWAVRVDGHPRFRVADCAHVSR